MLFRSATPLLAALPPLVLWAGCQCKPLIPNDPNDDEDTSKPDTAAPPDTGDTAATVGGPCAIEELEPNNSPEEAMALPLDTWLCGGFEAAFDADQYQFELPEDGWLGVYLDAQVRGSFADVTVTLTSDSGVNAGRDNDDDSRDAHLVIPASAGMFSALVIERNFNGGESYFYELLATVAKDPFEGNTAEVEPNDTSDAANVLVNGDRVEALVGNPANQDWYSVSIPAGRHSLTIDVDAYALGSPANLTLYAYDEGLAANPTEVVNGLAGSGSDPFWTYVSSGNETVWFRLEELTSSSGGSAWWYGLVLTVEAS